MPPNRFVLRGDLVDSRKAPASFGSRLNKALEAIRADTNWAVPPEQTAGIDEITGLTQVPTHAFDIAVRLNLELWPQRFRFCLARGAVDHGLAAGAISKMDGPAFHAAAAGIDRARDDNLSFVLDVDNDNAPIHQSAANLHLAVMQRWTPREAQTVQTARAHETRTAAAKTLNISVPAVTQGLARANHDALCNVETDIRNWLASLATKARR